MKNIFSKTKINLVRRMAWFYSFVTLISSLIDNWTFISASIFRLLQYAILVETHEDYEKSLVAYKCVVRKGGTF